MKSLRSCLAVLALGTIAMNANAGVLAGSARAVADVSKGAYSDAHFLAKAGAFPVLHPKRSARGASKAVKGSAKAVKATAKAVAKV
jgi:hypothetical protein